MTQPQSGPVAAHARAEFRRFALEHHPDRGGDPQVFQAGLAAYRATGKVRVWDPRLVVSVSVYRRRRGPAAVIDRLRRARQIRRRPPRVR